MRLRALYDMFFIGHVSCQNDAITAPVVIEWNVLPSVVRGRCLKQSCGTSKVPLATVENLRKFINGGLGTVVNEIGSLC